MVFIAVNGAKHGRRITAAMTTRAKMAIRSDHFFPKSGFIIVTKGTTTSTTV
jgi:hypothetical protein